MASENLMRGRALRDLLKLRPDFAATTRKDIEKWWEPEHGEYLIDGWRKAGLKVAGESNMADILPPNATVGDSYL